jgi:hypothetical protein
MPIRSTAEKASALSAANSRRWRGAEINCKMRDPCRLYLYCVKDRARVIVVLPLSFASC